MSDQASTAAGADAPDAHAETP
ncbi:phage holin family protein, partial [Xanthomonas oryzae pv. oryzae]